MGSRARDIERERLLKRIAEKRARLEARGDLNIKVPRLTLPSDFNIEDRNVFSLPPEILKPAIASSYPKYRKKLAEQKKKDEEQKHKMKSYIELRKQREEFRKKLVDLIVNKDDETDVDPNVIPSADEREVLRYYYYIKYGVDTVHVAPLDTKVLNRVLALVPKRLMKWEQTLNESIEDMKADFTLAVKKAIVDFVLQDPSFVKVVTEQETPFKKELKDMALIIKPAYKAAKTKLERNLHVINPCLAAILDIWVNRFRKLRLVNVEALKAHEGAFSLEEFKWTINSQIDACKETLMNDYYAAVTDVFLQGSKKNLLPDPAKPKKMKSFYNAVATIMTYNLQTLCLKSLYDYIHYVTDIKYSNRGFIIHLFQKINVLVFEPPFKHFTDALLNVVEFIVEAVMTVPRLECRLYLDMGEEVFLKPTIPLLTIEDYKDQICTLLENQRIGPELRVQDFDEYMPLINGEDEERINAFLAAEKSFDEYVEEILRYKQIISEIPIVKEHVVRMEMYDMERFEMIKSLVAAAENFRDILIHQCIKEYQTMCKM